MIPQEMIRKMAKPYTDKQIRGESAWPKVGTGWWSNGIIALFEDLPAMFADEKKEVPESTDLEMWGWTQADARQVWPVALRSGDGAREIETGGKTHSYAVTGCAMIQFVDDAGAEMWADAHYISSILKRDACTDWFLTGNKLLARNGKPLALLMPLDLRKDSDTVVFFHDWQIANHDLNAPKSLALARKVDALLPKGKKGHDWQAVTVNGRDVEARRQVNAGLSWKEGKVGRAHSTGLSSGVTLLPALVSKRTRKQVLICIRQGGQWAEIDLYDGHTRTGAA